MTKFLVLSLTLVGVATAFQRSAFFVFRHQQVLCLPLVLSPSALLASSSLDKDLVRAVECATKFNLCNVDELERLATKLENVNECLFEEQGEALCDKEMEDRKDVAEVLLLQRELLLRMDYIKNSNLFSEDVIKEHDIQEREKVFEILAEDAI
jgi:hypothetical protein